jgi:hypothetical protein
MKVLGKIGTERAIKPLQEYAEIFKPEPGEKADPLYYEILEGIELIKERSKQRPAMAPDADASHERGIPMLGLILIVPALLALFWQFWARRK